MQIAQKLPYKVHPIHPSEQGTLLKSSLRAAPPQLDDPPVSLHHSVDPDYNTSQSRKHTFTFAFAFPSYMSSFRARSFTVMRNLEISQVDGRGKLCLLRTYCIEGNLSILLLRYLKKMVMRE